MTSVAVAVYWLTAWMAATALLMLAFTAVVLTATDEFATACCTQHAASGHTQPWPIVVSFTQPPGVVQAPYNRTDGIGMQNG